MTAATFVPHDPKKVKAEREARQAEVNGWKNKLNRYEVLAERSARANGRVSIGKRKEMTTLRRELMLEEGRLHNLAGEEALIAFDDKVSFPMIRVRISILDTQD